MLQSRLLPGNSADSLASGLLLEALHFHASVSTGILTNRFQNAACELRLLSFCILSLDRACFFPEKSLTKRNRLRPTFQDLGFCTLTRPARRPGSVPFFVEGQLLLGHESLLQYQSQSRGQSCKTNLPRSSPEMAIPSFPTVCVSNYCRQPRKRYIACLTGPTSS
jgi:hypothetical protein